MKIPFLKIKKDDEELNKQLSLSALQFEARRLKIRASRRAGVDLIGQFQTSFRGTGLTFTELSEYEPGDDVRSIYWPASARSGRVYVKRYQEERSLRILLIFDISRSMRATFFSDTSQISKEVAALLCYVAKLSGDAIGLITFSQDAKLVAPISRKAHAIDQILLNITNAESEPGVSDLSSACELALKTLSKRSIVFILSDFVSQKYSEALTRLSARHSTHALYFGNSLDIPTNQGGLTLFRDPESGLLAELDIGSQKIKDLVSRRLAEHEESTRTNINGCGASFTSAGKNAGNTVRALINTQSRWRR